VTYVYNRKEERGVERMWKQEVISGQGARAFLVDANKGNIGRSSEKYSPLGIGDQARLPG